MFSTRGTSALHLYEATWIINGSNELIVDFLFALVLFFNSTQPRPFKNPKQIFFFGSNKRMTCKSNSNAKPNPGQHHSSFHLPLHSNAGLVFLFTLGPTSHSSWQRKLEENGKKIMHIIYIHIFWRITGRRGYIRRCFCLQPFYPVAVIEVGIRGVILV